MYIPRPITQDALLSLIPPAASSPQQPPIRAQKLWFFHTVKLSYSCLSLCQNASDGGWLPSSSELWITFACSNWFCPCYFHSCCGHSTKSYLHCALHGLNLQPRCGTHKVRLLLVQSATQHLGWTLLNLCCSLAIILSLVCRFCYGLIFYWHSCLNWTVPFHLFLLSCFFCVCVSWCQKVLFVIRDLQGRMKAWYTYCLSRSCRPLSFQFSLNQWVTSRTG